MNIGNMAKGMNDVERHGLVIGDDIEPIPNGDYVLYTDYAELQQQLAAAREALQAAEADAEIGRKWRADSSLETWFPLTAEEMERLRADAARYRWLRDSSSCSLTINHNDHHCVYQSVADTMDDTQGYYEYVSDDEKARMIATDSIWTIHEYPNTPVGFNVYHAATLRRCDL